MFCCSFRFGSFEIVKPEDASTGREGPSVGNKDILVALLDYVVSSFFPDASGIVCVSCLLC